MLGLWVRRWMWRCGVGVDGGGERRMYVDIVSEDDEWEGFEWRVLVSRHSLWVLNMGGLGLPQTPCAYPQHPSLHFPRRILQARAQNPSVYWLPATYSPASTSP